MCAGALVSADAGSSSELRSGGRRRVGHNFAADPRLRHNFEVVHNVLRDECSTALKDSSASCGELVETLDLSRCCRRPTTWCTR